MVKWFDSNYHYVKPTLQDNQTFKLAPKPKPILEFQEAKEAGIITRPVLLGPVSFLQLANTKCATPHHGISMPRGSSSFSLHRVLDIFAGDPSRRQ